MTANSRSGSHLSSLALEASDALLSPLSSHLECCWKVSKPKSRWRSGGELLHFADELLVGEEKKRTKFGFARGRLLN